MNDPTDRVIRPSLYKIPMLRPDRDWRLARDRLRRHVPTGLIQTREETPMISVSTPHRLAALLSATVAISAAPAPHYAVARSIAGPDGGWDYAKIDPATRRLYVARATDVMVVDPRHGDAVSAIGDIAKSHAVVPIAGKTLLVTSAHDDSVRLLDTGDGHEIARIAVGSDPDAAFYNAASGEAVVMNAKAGTVSVIDIAKWSVARTVALKPGLEYGVLADDGMVFVNNEDENEIESFDLKLGKIGVTIAMPGCTGPTGLGYDAKTARLISACDNGKAAVVDTKTKRMIALLPIGLGPDAVIDDAARRLAFVLCGKDGVLTMIALDAAGGPRVAGTIKTEAGARTGALDPADGTLYLPTARYAAAAAPSAKPVPIPGSFHILVVSPR
jgi:YVTN family beta-propeller protein